MAPSRSSGRMHVISRGWLGWLGWLDVGTALTTSAGEELVGAGACLVAELLAQVAVDEWTVALCVTELLAAVALDGLGAFTWHVACTELVLNCFRSDEMMK